MYNTFPVPKGSLDGLKPYTQEVLDARDAHPDSTLAGMYDPDMMPPDLSKMHRRLDRMVDRLYRKEPFRSDDGRMEFLLNLYDGMIQ